MAEPYIFKLASQRSQWLTTRETMIAGNVANANTPGYRATDLQPFSSVLDSTQMTMATTNPMHMTPTEDDLNASRVVETEPSDETISGNSVRTRRPDDQARRGEPGLYNGHEPQARHASNDDVCFEVSDYA